jgi:hypothetical protein
LDLVIFLNILIFFLLLIKFFFPQAFGNSALNFLKALDQDAKLYSYDIISWNPSAAAYNDSRLKFHLKSQLDFNLTDIDQQSYGMKDTLLEALSYDKFLGKFDEVIRKSNLLLSKSDPYSKNRRLLRTRGHILEYQAQVYAKLGNIPAMQEAFKESIKIAVRSGDASTNFLMDFIKLAIQNNDLSLARFYVNALEKRLNKSDPEVRDLLIGLIPMLRGYLNQLDANTETKEELAKAFYLKAAAWQEKFYYELLDDKPDYGLDVLYALHKNFLDASDKQMAALYAKVYINKIQD